MSHDGFLLINKPEGPSSFDAVKRARRVFKTKKAGHCGTLDPLASGLLIVAIGKATRLIPDLPIEPKIYEFGVQFGKTTTTLDREGEISESGGKIPSEKEITSILSNFIGKVEQTPPKFSAIKINGVPAYKLARKDKDFEIKSRTIDVFNLDLIGYNEKSGVADMRVKCSGGTYVRVLCEQIAEKLETFAYASYIHRVGIGDYSVENAISLNEEDDIVFKALHSPWNIFKEVQKELITVDDEKELSHGREISIENCEAERVFLFKEDKELAAIAEKKDNGNYGPKKVFI